MEKVRGGALRVVLDRLNKGVRAFYERYCEPYSGLAYNDGEGECQGNRDSFFSHLKRRTSLMFISTGRCECGKIS